MDNFRLADVSKLVDQTFTLQLADIDGNPISHAEDEIVDTFEAPMVNFAEAACNGDDWEAFKVVFKVKPKQAILEHHYVLKHEAIGEVCLYGSPNSPEEIEFCCSYERAKLS